MDFTVWCKVPRRRKRRSGRCSRWVWKMLPVVCVAWLLRGGSQWAVCTYAPYSNIPQGCVWLHACLCDVCANKDWHQTETERARSVSLHIYIKIIITFYHFCWHYFKTSISIFVCRAAAIDISGWLDTVDTHVNMFKCVMLQVKDDEPEKMGPKSRGANPPVKRIMITIQKHISSTHSLQAPWISVHPVFSVIWGQDFFIFSIFR